MDIEVSAEAKDKALNRKVAITVVALSVFMGLCGIKDGNIVQAMQAAQSSSVDQWNEYQATRTKLHIDQANRAEIVALAPDAARAAPVVAELDRNIAKYAAETPELARKANEQGNLYTALNIHDDQFDASDAAVSTAISIAAVAALAEAGWLLYFSWAFGAFGVTMGLAGFLGWSLHPDLLSTFLG